MTHKSTSLRSDWVQVIHPTRHASFRRRSSQPISWLDTEETKSNTIKASNTEIKWPKLTQTSAKSNMARGRITILSPLVAVNGFVQSWSPSNKEMVDWDHTSQRPKWHLGRFSHFCTAHPCAQNTNTQTTIRVTSVATGWVSCTTCRRCGLRTHKILNLNKRTKTQAKPKPTSKFKNCSHVCAYHCAKPLYTTQHQTVWLY